MWTIIERARKIIFVLMLSVIPLILLYAQSKDKEIRKYISKPFIELSGYLEQASLGLSGIFSDFLFSYFYFASRAKELRSLRAMAQENHVLKAKVEELINEKMSILELKDKTSYLKNFKPEYAKVIATLGFPLSRMIRIEKGSLNGIKAKDPVIANEGVVGQVITAAPHFSDVLLVTDASSALDAKIISSNTRGILRGFASGTKHLMELVDIDGLFSVQNGDIVVTSGINSMFPGGIPIGIVTFSKKSKDGLWIKARLDPFVDFKKLDYVSVLTKVTLQEEEQSNVLNASWPLAIK